MQRGWWRVFGIDAVVGRLYCLRPEVHDPRGHLEGRIAMAELSASTRNVRLRGQHVSPK